MSSSFCRTAWRASKSKYLVSVAAAVMLAACSNAVERFAENPSDSDPVYTASVPRHDSTAPGSDMEAGDGIAARPLDNAAPKIQAYDYKKSYQKPAYQQQAVAEEAPLVEEQMAPAPQASATGTVVIRPGMTLYGIARANNLTVSQLAAANGIRPPYSVNIGQTLRIPGRQAASLSQTTSAQPIKASVPATASVSRGVHTVASGETLFSLGRTYGLSPYTIADANGLSHNAHLSLGQAIRIPSGGQAAPAPVAQKSQSRLQQEASVEPSAIPEADASEQDPPDEVAAAQPTPKTESPSAPAAEMAPIGGGATGMRWPVRGKVISAFGPKSNGLKNEGINIAVPEGTSVRAAGDGVVAYAGNELKGYGNLILIRHEDGYVTAYAHAKELFVKRGDTVKRGDVIAKAGQTGSVSSPQLHFEVRKGATALDPLKFLSSSTASN